jgi:hypothetical protein
VDPDEFGQMIDEVNGCMTKLAEVAAEMAKVTCRFAILTVATCGLGAFCGGMCYIMGKARDAQV